MYLVVIRHAGVVMDVDVTADVEEWMETEGKMWKGRYVGATFKVLPLTKPSRPARQKKEDSDG